MRRETKYRLIGLFIGFFILLALVYHVGFERFYHQVSHASPYLIALSVIIYASSWIFRTLRLDLFTTHAGKNIKILDLFKLYIAGYALNVLLPAKLGDVATVGFLKMKGINIGRSTAIIIQTRILDVLALILLSLPAFIAISYSDSPHWLRSMILICLLVVAAPIGIVTLDKHKKIISFFDKFGERFSQRYIKLTMEKTKEAYEGYHEIVSNKKLLVASILLSVMIWLFDGLTCYSVSVAVGAKISIFAVLLAVSFANVGKSAPATPGAVGIYEGLLSAVMVFFGVPFDIAIAIAILDHAIKNIFTLLLGIPSTLTMGVSLSQLNKVRERDTND